MQRALAVTALLVLSCGACAAAERAPTDTRWVHARESFDEARRLQTAGQYAQSVSLFERAFFLSEEHLRQAVPGSSETQLASVLHLLHTDEEHIYALVRAHPDDARVRHLALTAALLRKNRFVQELAALSRGMAQSDREDFERLRALRTQLATLSLAGPGELSPAHYQQRLEELAGQGDALEADLARRSAPLRAFHAPPSPPELMDRVTAALPRDGALVEFVAYRDSPLVSQPGSESPSEPRYLALLLFPDGRTQAVDLGPAAPIDRAALLLRDTLANRAVAYQPAAQKLHALAFRPLMPLLGKVRRLLVAPDAQLAFVPFAALHDGRQFLLDTFDITYLGSGTDLLRRPEDVPPARSVVVLADPDLAPRPSAPSLSNAAPTQRSNLADQPWPPLPGTRLEAEAIQRLFPQARLLLGPAATKDALLSLATPGLLHISTHGFFLDEALPLSPNPVNGVEASRGATAHSNPWRSLLHPQLRSGLVLAAARAPAAPSGSLRREDALVTALELAGLDLWGTQLVVLSACETGRGDFKPGQGVYGLRRALVIAGAETLVTSLWKLNDEATRQLLEGYYRRLSAGQGRITALNEAMRALRKKQPHPYYWAPFLAIGQDSPLRGLAPSSPARP